MMSHKADWSWQPQDVPKIPSRSALSLLRITNPLGKYLVSEYEIVKQELEKFVLSQSGDAVEKNLMDVTLKKEIIGSYVKFLNEANSLCNKLEDDLNGRRLKSGFISREKKLPSEADKQKLKNVLHFLEKRSKGPFTWPNLDEIRYGISGLKDFHALDEGVFSSFGYHVGGKGVFYSKRREILDHIFKTDITGQKHLPASYLSGWGSPMTEYRLKKMAFTLASFCRLHNSTKLEAVSDWKHDLDYLKKKYYDPKAWTWWPDPITYAKGMP